MSARSSVLSVLTAPGLERLVTLVYEFDESGRFVAVKLLLAWS